MSGRKFHRHIALSSSKKISTNRLAEILDYKPDSIRRSLCTKGHFLGLKPVVKLPNGQLRWNEEEALALLEG